MSGLFRLPPDEAHLDIRFEGDTVPLRPLTAMPPALIHFGQGHGCIYSVSCSFSLINSWMNCTVPSMPSTDESMHR